MSQEGEGCPSTQSAILSTDETIIYAYGDNTKIDDLKDIIADNVKLSCKSTPKSKYDNPDQNQEDDDVIFVSQQYSVKLLKCDISTQIKTELFQDESDKEGNERVVLMSEYDNNIKSYRKTETQIKAEVICIADDSAHSTLMSKDRQFISLSPSSKSESCEGTAEFQHKPATVVKLHNHNQNKNLPIHSTPNSGLDAKALVSLCFGESLKNMHRKANKCMPECCLCCRPTESEQKVFTCR